MKELGLIEKVLHMLSNDTEFCLYAMYEGCPSPLNYMLDERDGMDSILLMASRFYERNFASPSELHQFLDTRPIPVTLDHDEMIDEFIAPAKELIRSIASEGVGGLRSANRIRSYFAKVRNEIGYPSDISEAEGDYDKEGIIAPFVARRYQYFSGLAEFIDSMNRFASTHSDECINEEMAIMLGIMERWEAWELLNTKPILGIV